MAPTALISGGGVAGATLAYWLGRNGYRVTVVERSAGLRSSGAPVDVRGPAAPVVAAMGITERLRSAATRTTAVSIIDADGRQVGRLRSPQGGPTRIELPRADLAAILLTTASETTEVIMNDAVATLAQDAGGVDVRFASDAERRFDIVVGADGLHSATRRLVFGPERKFSTHLGLYIATFPAAGLPGLGTEVLLHNLPGKLAAIHPGREAAGVALIFRHREVAVADKDFVITTYPERSWRLAELVEQLQAAADPYIDAVNRVRVPRWADGRIVLLGDAASCVSLLGEGSSMAIAGAYRLAKELGRQPHDAAFRTYEARHRRVQAPFVRTAHLAAGILVPKTGLGIAARNLASKVVA